MSMTPTAAPSALATLSNNKASVADRAKALETLISKRDSDLMAILPKHVSLDRIKQMFILSVKQTPKLLDCDPASLMKSLFTAASMGLEPDPYFGQVYLLPYGKNVQVIPGYKGLMKLVRNSGEIASISCEAVHVNDYFEYELGSDPRVVHRPSLKDRGDIIAFYCVAKFKDGSLHIEWMNKEEVDRIKNMSAAVKSGQNTPWKEHYEEMGKKTVFRRAVKRLPVSLSKEMTTAIQIDDGAHNGKVYQVDEQTGEIIDIWADNGEETSAALSSASGASSHLDKFAADMKAETTEEETTQQSIT